MTELKYEEKYAGVDIDDCMDVAKALMVLGKRFKVVITYYPPTKELEYLIEVEKNSK